MSYELGPLGATYPRADLSTVDIDWSMVDHSVGARVTRGMLYIQRTYGTAASKVDPNTLDIADACECVLGQIHGSYALAPEAQTWTYERKVAHGFMLGVDDWFDLELQAYPLSIAWREAFHAWRALDPRDDARYLD